MQFTDSQPKNEPRHSEYKLDIFFYLSRLVLSRLFYFFCITFGRRVVTIAAIKKRFESYNAHNYFNSTAPQPASLRWLDFIHPTYRSVL